jgi:hypothetical protein
LVNRLKDISKYICIKEEIKSGIIWILTIISKYIEIEQMSEVKYLYKFIIIYIYLYLLDDIFFRFDKN